MSRPTCSVCGTWRDVHWNDGAQTDLCDRCLKELRKGGDAMKCEHEGCGSNASSLIVVKIYNYRSKDEEYSGNYCRSHLAAWLREKADEVEGVRECEACGGYGITGVNWCNRCASCHGTGRVPR